MTYAIAKAARTILENRHREAADHLRCVSGEKSPTGLTPDAIKFTPEWQEAYKNERRAFDSLRDHNMAMFKRYSKELREDRNARRQARKALRAA